MDTPTNVSLKVIANQAIDQRNLEIDRRNESERRSNLRANITYAIGAVLAFLGTAMSFLAGVDWSVLFRPETAALAGASVMFVRALVVFLQRRPNQ